jgi:uncharacterized protein
MIDKNTNRVMLFDCYQPLLTDKQRQMMDLYYNQDLTLAEIAEELQISRQGVYDHLKRTVHILEQYEAKMMLLETFQRQSRLIQRLKQLAANLESQLAENPDMEGALDQVTDERIPGALYQISTS